jgi:protein ImuB
MFAALYSLSAPVDALVRVAQDYSPRVEAAGTLVLADLHGVARLFGGPDDTAAHMRRALAGLGAVRLALAPTETAAALLALGRPGGGVVPRREAVAAALAALPVSVLGELERCRALLPSAGDPAAPGTSADDGLSWGHPRETHQGQQTRRQVAARRPALGGRTDVRLAPGVARRPHGPAARARAVDAEQRRVADALEVLRRWGIRTCGQLAALPPAEVAERLGGRGTRWLREARGDETRPLVPMVEDETFEATLDLEWPIEGLEPLSFVLGRLLDPLAVRLERRDRGAAVLHTELQLVSREVHARTLQLPAPMREPKTLRTLILLDLESHPPAAAIDRVTIRVEPTPGRVLQWSLLERAQPSPEQVSTLIARLSALMGESHVGTPALVDSWRPGAFAMRPFEARPAGAAHASGSATASARDEARDLGVAFRRFRIPVPARVVVKEGRPQRVTPDRRGVAAGPVLEAAGPWRTSGHWWEPRPAQDRPVGTGGSTGWDRDEWDVLLADGTACRVFLERDVGQWYVEGVFD